MDQAQDLRRLAASGDNVRVRSEEEARQRGLVIMQPQPPDTKCEFCGKTLRHEGIAFGGAVVTWCQTPESCTCEKAVAKAKADAAEKKRQEEEEARRERQRKMQTRIFRLIGNSGIKKRFQQRTFETFRRDTPKQEAAYKIAKAYADNFQQHLADGTGLYIEGSNGTGKTHLAAAISMQLITQRGVAVICKTAGDLLLDIRNAYDESGATEKQVQDIYKKVDLLVIDDLGKEQCTDWSISVLYSIINDRYEDMKPTIITTNYNSDDLARALTPKGYDSLKVKAIISRLREVSQLVTMVWKDYRSKADE